MCYSPSSRIQLTYFGLEAITFIYANNDFIAYEAIHFVLYVCGILRRSPYIFAANVFISVLRFEEAVSQCPCYWTLGDSVCVDGEFPLKTF